MKVPKSVIFAAALSGVFVFAGPPALSAFTPSGLLEIHYVNVQQGQAALLIGPDGTTVLLDAGRSAAMGAQIVTYLQSLDLDPEDGLDYTVASHMDADHIRGFKTVFESGYDVRFENWYNGSPKSNTAVTAYKTAAAETTAGDPIAAVLDDTIDLGGGAVLTVVAVGGQVIGYGSVPGAETENDLSIAVLVEYGDFTYLWAGDLGGGDDDTACTGRQSGQANVETPLAESITPGGAWPLLSGQGVDVLHVNHHGSRSSTNSDYMNLLQPEVAVIAVGDKQDPDWHHPRLEAVDNVLLAQAPCVTAAPALVLQTEEGAPLGSGTSSSGYAVGDVKISTDGVEYTVEATGNVSQGPDERAAAGLPRSFPAAELGLAKVILTEVFYDAQGADNRLEWVELCNSGTTAVNLSGYSLGNGGSAYTFSKVQLSGILGPGETFVVGGPASNALNARPVFNRLRNFNPDFQNSGSVADGVALFGVPARQVRASTVPIDAVVYGRANSNNLIDETGVANTPEVADARPGSSIERVDFPGRWKVQPEPTPNTSVCLRQEVLLSEVFYDPQGADDRLEWVELYNSGTTAVDLSTYSLGNGGSDYTYSKAQLSGIVGPGETFVIGGPRSNARNARPAFDRVRNFTPDFQNSGSVADGVALFNVPARRLRPSTVPIDAVVYGRANRNNLIDETGASHAPEVGDARPGFSIERVDLLGNWRILSSPTPNTTPLGGP